MDNKLIESYLENISELVIDEEKIVTYKFISRNFGVHVNTAKQLLHTFLLKQRDESTCPVSATYLLAGKFDDGSLNVTVVNESDLKRTSEKFAEITSQHVYSVQKGNELKDVRVLAGVCNGVKNDTSSNVVIKCSKSFLKARDQGKEKGGVSESNTQDLKSKHNNHITNETIHKVPAINDGELNNKTESPEKSKKQETPKSPVKKSSPNTKTKTESPTKINSEKKSANSKFSKPKQNIANFFANAAQKNSEKLTSALETKKSILNKENDKNSTVDIPQTTETDVLHENKSQATTVTKKNKLKDGLKKKKGNKRKRIQVFSDSEESDSSSEEPPLEKEEDEEEEENTEPPNAILEEEKEEIKEMPRNKRKKRKVIDKTVMSEDGYLETRKEVVLATDSEEESVVEDEKKTNSSNHQQKKLKSDEGEEKSKSIPASNALKKQSSLLSFFKKT